MPFRRAVILAFLFLLAVAPASAKDFSTRYDMWLYGIPVGRADFNSRFENGHFAVSGRFRSAGLARIFEAVDGTVSVNGRIAGSGARPSDYELDYVSGDDRQKTVIRYDGRKARAARNTPKLKHGKTWVEVEPKHLVDAADPLSALLVGADTPAGVCKRTVKLYDGELRLDLVMRPAPPGDALKSGAVTCRVTFKPVSGFRPNHSTVRYLRDKASMVVAFAPVEGTRLYSPVEATVGTKVGTLWIKARPTDGK